MSSNNRRIQRVPALLIAEDEDEMKKKKNDYYPQVVSIGPYHYGAKPELAQVEAFKPVAVDLLVRGEKDLEDFAVDLLVRGEKDLEDFFYQEVLAMIGQVRNFYEKETVDKFSDADLAQMMLRDASLIIAEMEIYLEHGETYDKRKAMIDHFGRLTGAVLFRDFILVENQIPLCVIQRLIELAGKEPEMINNYVNKCIFGEIRPIVKYSRVPLHLLEFMHIILVQPQEPPTETSNRSIKECWRGILFGAPNHTVTLGPRKPATETSNRSIEEGCGGKSGGAPVVPKALIHTLNSVPLKPATETSNRSIEEGWGLTIVGTPNHTVTLGDPPFRVVEARVLQGVQTEASNKAKKVSNKAKKVTHSFRKVMELKARGIHFRPSATQSLLDVEFKSGFFYATLQLPEMFVSHYSKPFFKNLVAYELLPGVETEPRVTSFINLMQSLVERPEDLEELRERKIVYNKLGSDEEALNVFKDINTHGTTDDELYYEVREKIQKHYNNRIKTWIAELIHTHFRSPWTFIAFLAAAAIIALTAAQLYYAVHPVADKTPTSS